MRALALFFPAVLAACAPWDRIPGDGYVDLTGPLWDPAAVPADDGAYIRLPAAGALVVARPDGSWSPVDLKGAAPVRLVGTPDGSRVLAVSSWPICALDDADIVLVDDCPSDELSVGVELNVVQDGRVVDVFPHRGHLNQQTFTPDGRTLVQWHAAGLAYDVEQDGITDLTEVVFQPLDGGERRAVSLGVPTQGVIFTQDQSKAVVLSVSQAVLVDLATFEIDATFPLVTDPDVRIAPQDAVLSPDGSQVIVAMQGRPELYKIDLTTYSIDIEDLDAVPADLAVVPAAERTFIGYDGLARVDVLDHALDELTDQIAVDDPMGGLLVGEGRVVGWNREGGSRDVVKVDSLTGKVTEYPADRAVTALGLAGDGRYAIGLLGGRPVDLAGGALADAGADGLVVVDLDEGTRATSLTLSSAPVALETVSDGAGGGYALLLLDGVETLLQLDLATPSFATEVELPAPPVRLTSLPDGTFVVLHDEAFGLVSFLSPGATEVGKGIASGFATMNLLSERALPRRGED